MEKKHILLVDEDHFTVNTLEVILEMGHHEVTTAECPEEALHHIAVSRIEGNPINLIITDTVTPDRNGLDLVESLERNDLRIPVIILSDNIDLRTQMIVEEKTNVYGIAKPFVFEKLLLLITQILKKQETERDGARDALRRIYPVELSEKTLTGTSI